MMRRFDRKYAVISMVMLTGVVALMALSLQTAGQLREDVAELDRAHELQLQARRITATLADLETDHRDYLLTLEPAALEPYRAGLARLDDELGVLSSATDTRPDLAAQIKRLGELVGAKRAELARTIAVADTRGVGAALMEMRDNRGRALMDDIRQVVSNLETLEGVTRAQQQAARSARIERGERFVSLLAAALAMLIVAVYALVRRDRALQEQILRDEASSRHLLEQRVQERTSKLETAARSLALSEQRLRGIFDSATDGILTADGSQIIVEANPAAARLFHCTVNDLIGTPLDRVIPARYREAHRQSVQAFGAGVVQARPMGSDAGRNVVALRFDGQEIPIEASISRVDVDGQRLYTVIHRDISERVKSEAALRESRSRLATALASMSDAVCISDAEGRFVEFNDGFASFHRFRSRGECRQTLPEYQEVLEVFMADGTLAPLEQWPVSRALRGEVASGVENRLRRKDTGESWVGSYSFAPIRAEDGSIVGSVVVGRDVTHDRQTQLELAASHSALQDLIANQQHVQEEERKRIARELHDDLQQPLAAIRMDAVGVGERVSKGRSDIEPLLTRIDKLSGAAIASTRRIVSDLRPEMLEEFGLVAALEAMCAQHAERTGSDCRLEVSASVADANLDASVLSTGLYRVTQEALNNVAKHANANSVRVVLDCERDGLVVLRVRDNGIGMHHLDRRKPESFGLQGMAERVRALGGLMRVEAQGDAGTTVEVSIPILTPGPPDGQPGDAEPTVWPLAHEQQRPSAKPDTWRHALQTVIDALTGNVAVLDALGVVQLTNRAWKQFAELNGDSRPLGCGPGANYLELCLRSASGDPAAQVVVQGLRAVLDGREPAFMSDYSCDTPGGRRRFRTHAASLTGGMVIVTHVEIGTRIDRSASPGGNADVPLH